MIVFSESNRNTYINFATSSYEPGSIITQDVLLTDSKTISKIGLDLNVTNRDKKSLINSIQNDYSFSATNFQSSRESHKWKIFDDNISIYLEEENKPASQGYLTTVGNNSFSKNAAQYNAPYTKYDILFEDTGTFSFWSRYHSPETNGFFYQLDNSNTLISFPVNINNDISWELIGILYIEKIGIHTITLYQGTFGDNPYQEPKYIDQFYLTKGHIPTNGEIQPVSPAPFNTFVKLSNINDPYNSNISYGWKSSNEIKASGRFYYNMYNTEFSEHLRIEYTQIGGNENFFAAWGFAEVSPSVGDTKFSYNWGNSNVQLLI